MTDERVPIFICPTESQSWDKIWQWAWFTRDSWWSSYRQEAEPTASDLVKLLQQRGARSVLDAACGLGRMTILLAESGFEAEGADASAVAASQAPQLAREKGFSIRIMHARNEELGQKCGRTYDSIFSDGFDELASRDVLAASARGMYAVLRDGGFLAFVGIPQDWSPREIRAAIDQDWQKRMPFEVSFPFEQGGIKVTQMEVDEKIPDGILEKRIFLIEEHGDLRVEIAHMLNRRKWTFGVLHEVLTGAGFSSVHNEQVGRTLFTIAAK